MKRLLTSSLCALLLLSMTGCQDAHAKLKSSNDVVFTVGNQSYTKGQIYSMLNTGTGSSVILNEAMKEICGAEIEVTDEMKENAQSIYDNYKTMYGDTFENSLKASGMTSETYINNLVFSEQKSKLTEKYINDRFDSLCDLYMPIKATIVYFNEEDSADKALSALKDGSKSVADVITEYNSSSLGNSEVITINTSIYPAEVTAYVRSGSVDDGWQKVPTSTEDRYYIAHIDDTEPNNFKDEVVSTLTSISSVTNDCQRHYFETYNFHVYDKDIYDALNETNPDLLVQKN